MNKTKTLITMLFLVMASSFVGASNLDGNTIWRVLDSSKYSPSGQSFVPSRSTISGVSLALAKIGNPDDIEIRIGTSFGSSEVYSGKIDSDDVVSRTYATKMDCEFVDVTFRNKHIKKGQTYYIWLKPKSGNYTKDWYNMCVTRNNIDLYPKGTRCDVGKCPTNNYAGDMLFKTYFSHKYKVDQTLEGIF
ncbi:MAG: hypothetical protein KKD48_03555 [Nanoarchaeota archaeon]|nr:hypothetical protein [Nanoarchaeota archaeon]